MSSTGTDRDLPIDTPTGIPDIERRPPRARPSRSAITAAPALGNPRRLTSAWSAGRRKRFGAGLAACGRAVTVPISRCANPRAARARGRRASLSNPAASPSGWANSRPIARTTSRSSCSGASAARTQVRSRPIVSTGPSARNAPVCAAAGGIAKSSGRSARLYIVLEVGSRLGAAGTRSTRQAPHGGEQLLQIDGLGQVLSRPRGVHGRDDHDRNARQRLVRLELLEDFPATQDGHHQIEEHEIGSPLLANLEHGLVAVLRAHDVVPIVSQHLGHDLPDGFVVVYHEDIRARPQSFWHGFSRKGRRRAERARACRLLLLHYEWVQGSFRAG